MALWSAALMAENDRECQRAIDAECKVRNLNETVSACEAKYSVALAQYKDLLSKNRVLLKRVKKMKGSSVFKDRAKDKKLGIKEGGKKDKMLDKKLKVGKKK